jgi:hypothetical protein
MSRIKMVVIALTVLLSWPLSAEAQGGKPLPPKPVISSFSPKAGAPGTTVELAGTNFSKGYTVWLGATQVTLVDLTATKIKVKIPDNAKTGRFVLKGTYIVESKSLFSVVENRPPPKIESFSPLSGSPGTQVVISGSNFSTQTFENIVMLGNTQVPVKSSAPGQLIVIIPKDAVTGKFSLTIAGGGTSTSPAQFVVVLPLTIKGFSPESGPPGTEVTLFGTGFGSNIKAVIVTMGGKKVKVLGVAEDKIRLEVPKDAITAPFLLEITGKTKVLSGKSFDIKIPPEVKAFSPPEGYPGAIVTLYGFQFGSSELHAKVTLGSKTVKILTLTDNKIEVQIPKDGETGKFTVTVTGKGSSTAEKAFTVWVPLSVTSFTPEKGEVGTIVTVKGQGFLTDVKKVKVTLGNLPLQIVGLTPTSISVKIPSKAASGKIEVDVKGRGKAESPESFTVVYPPVVYKFAPKAGQAGQIITVYGKNFGYSTDNIRVWIGPEKQKQFCIVQMISDGKLTCTIQPNTVSGPVIVHVKDMGKVVTNETMTVLEPLVVTGFSPKSGMPGTTVTISGTGFSSETKNNIVKIGKIFLKAVSSSPNQLIVQIPESLKEGGSFEVSVKGRSGKALSASSFELIIPAKIAKITPTAGPIGTTVRILGQGFGTDLQMIQVTLLGFFCPIVALTPSEVQVQIPPGLIPNQSEGKFQVIVNPGGIAESPASFKVMSSKPKGKGVPKPKK